MAVALLLAVLVAAVPAAASPGAPAVAPDGTVAAPEGARFRLPRGLRYSVVSRPDASRVYAAQSADGTTFVGVTVFQSEGRFGCDDDGATDLGLKPFRTATGYAACGMVIQPEDSALAVAASFVSAGAAIVAVTVVAPTRREAAAAADAVAASVRIGGALAAGRSTEARTLRAPGADARLVGCFERSGDVHARASFAITHATLCLREDFTFTRTSKFEVSTPAGGAGSEDAFDGLWGFEEGRLTLSFEDEEVRDEELPVGFEDGALILGGTPWERIR